MAVRAGTGLAKNQGECRASGLVPGDTCLIRHLAGRHAKFNEKNIHDHKPYPQCEALVYRIVWDASWTPDWSLLSECQKGKAKKRAFNPSTGEFFGLPAGLQPGPLRAPIVA